jgi:hypothetical protein
LKDTVGLSSSVVILKRSIIQRCSYNNRTIP